MSANTDWYDHAIWAAGLALASVIGIIVIWKLISAFYGPIYRVWSAHKLGQADLARAENDTRIAVLRADRECEAARHLAAADVERAKGIALSIREVEASLGGPEGYLRWKYIHMLEETDIKHSIIYIPTEAGLPILEAGKAPRE